jgi:PPM family protein phosphatase
MEPEELQAHQVDIFGVTDIGRRRSTNQDHFLISSLHKTMEIFGTSLPNAEGIDLTSPAIGYFLMVADGVGGTAGGGEASSMTLENLARYITQTMKSFYGRDLDEEAAFISELADSVGEIHERILEEGRGPDGFEGMASTLTMAIVVWPKAYVVQVGDSRCYQLRAGELVQITRDQTMAQELADEGVITPEQAEKSQLSNVLSSAIGGPKASPDITVLSLEFDDTLLLCSDGLIKHVSDEEIRAALDTDDRSELICKKLINSALLGGGTDNVTVVVGRSRRA